MSRQSLSRRYQAVYQVLCRHYGQPQWQANNHLPPVDELVSTILSQNTSDSNRDRAFHRLKARFSSWEELMAAPEADVAEAIRPAGLARQKAPRIQEALRTIQRERGRLELDFLATLPLEEARQWLTSMRGVGPKTAAIVLLFAFGRPAFPVDTHVYRVARRLGLISSKVTADKAHEIMENRGEPAGFYAMHLNLIRHGREVCRAQRPLCPRCPLQEQCDTFRQLRGEPA